MMRSHTPGGNIHHRTSRKCCEQVDEIGEGGVDFLFASQSFGNAAHEQEACRV